jgi:hypothetical protein
MTEPTACGDFDCRPIDEALPDREGKAAEVMAKPANSRRLRRVMFGGYGTILGVRVGFMCSAL